MTYLGASNMIYSDVIDSFISETLKYESSAIVFSMEKTCENYASPSKAHSYSQ